MSRRQPAARAVQRPSRHTCIASDLRVSGSPDLSARRPTVRARGRTPESSGNCGAQPTSAVTAGSGRRSWRRRSPCWRVADTCQDGSTSVPPRPASAAPPGAGTTGSISFAGARRTGSCLWWNSSGTATDRRKRCSRFSQARHLRLLGYRGRLRVCGRSLPDRYGMARRSGSDEVAIDPALAEREPEALWLFHADRWAHDYQVRLGCLPRGALPITPCSES